MAEITQEVSGVWSVCIEGGEKMFDGVILIGVGRNLIGRNYYEGMEGGT